MARGLVLDTLDDRREMHALIERLPPPRRLAYLRWCCAQTGQIGYHQAKVDPWHSARSMEVYFDVWALHTQYGLNLDKALEKLVEIVRGRQGKANNPNT